MQTRVRYFIMDANMQMRAVPKALREYKDTASAMLNPPAHQSTCTRPRMQSRSQLREADEKKA